MKTLDHAIGSVVSADRLLAVLDDPSISAWNQGAVA